MGFRFAESFGPDHVSQRAEMERLSAIGQLRKDALLKARAVRLLVIQPNGKPRRHEPERIARSLNVTIKRVNGWIYDVQRQVDYLVERARISRPQAWVQIKNVWDPKGRAPWVTVERGIQRSKTGRHAGARERPGRRGVYERLLGRSD